MSVEHTALFVHQAMVMAIFFVAGFTTIAAISLYSGMPMLGWGLVALIIMLAAIALVGWCAGCYSYYMLNKLG